MIFAESGGALRKKFLPGTSADLGWSLHRSDGFHLHLSPNGGDVTAQIAAAGFYRAS